MGLQWIMVASMAVTATPAEAVAPCTFARSGEQAAVTLASHERSVPEAVVLRAFGRVWCDPAPVRGGVAKIAVPTVQRPVVFAIASAGQSAPVFGELIAYPCDNAPWPGEAIRIYAADAPSWFHQWANAVGISLHVLGGQRLSMSLRSNLDAHDEVLVVGSEIAGQSVDGFLELAKASGVNVLALDATWYAQPVSDSVTLEPLRMVGPLEALQTQHWARRPVFANPPSAPPVIINRRSWIQSARGPVVEQFEPSAGRGRVVLSYLPWEQQLGRNDVADELLLAVLRAAASPMPPQASRRRVYLYPDTQSGPERCPVLAVATGSSAGPAPVGTLNVLDLRGNGDPPRSLRGIGAVLHERTSPDCPLLILGDDPLLDKWRWLLLDRRKQTVIKPTGVEWLPNDTLPPPEVAQMALMESLTIYGVSLGDAQWRKRHESE